MEGTKDFLLELGTEEIPARFLPPVIEQMEALSKAAFEEQSLAYEGLKVYGTPRRLALKVMGLVTMQPDSITEAKGPSLAAAYDAQGNPTKALLGFCKGRQINPQDVLQKEISGNLYIYASKQVPGKPTAEVLPELLLKLIGKLYFPKPMRWGYEEMRFARPIRWLVVLYGDDVLPLTLAGKESGRITRGHRTLGSQEITLAVPGEYESKLEANYVIVDQDKRRRLIEKQIEDTAKACGGFLKKDEELLEEVVYILEYPTALAGSFAEKYLQIPKELVITPMREHQRYFPVYNQDGGLLPNFITVRNGDARYLSQVAEGNEKVLRSRLSDAEFFWREDCKTPLAELAPKLEGIIFHEKLGTVRSKVARLRKLAAYIGKALGFDAGQMQKLDRTVFLMKNDLVSHAVYEFTELQGIMGEYYALHDGEAPEVAASIREHYQPRFAGDDLPQSPIGQAASLADKLDSLMGFLAIGMQPSGSQDPYALRRAAAGCVQIIVRNQLELPLAQLLAAAYELLAADISLTVEREECCSQAAAFLTQRLENLLNEEGIDYDVVNAACAAGTDNLYDTYLRAVALNGYRREAGFAELLAGFKRAANLVRNALAQGELAAGVHLVSEALLAEDAESSLWKEVVETKKQSEDLVAKRQYLAALEAIGNLRSVIDGFFTDVMVMTDDVKLRQNRLALLSNIVALTNGIGDLSLIVA